MITKTIDKKKQMVTFSTTLVVDGRYVNLSYSRLLGYLETGWEKRDVSFETYFLWPKEAFTDPKLNHATYKQIVASNYTQLGAWQELCWEEVKI